MPATSTRERLVTEAMRLFGEQGYSATSIVQIEAAAGLAPGSGALYHHFKSKEALLDAGIDRQLDRRHAMRDIRALFAGLGDLHAELTMLARYLLTVLDDEFQLLRIAARIPAHQSARLTAAHAALFDSLYAELADWINGWTPDTTPETAATLGALGVNALHGRHAASTAFDTPHADTADEHYLTEWTATLASRIESLRHGDGK